MTPIARLIATTGILAAAALSSTGCAAATPAAQAEAPATSTTTPQPERTADPNDQACVRFAESHNTLASLLSDGKGDLTVEAWKQAHKDEVLTLDEHSLGAEGDVAERMKAAVDIIPAAPLEMVLPDGWRMGDEYNQAIAKVYTACKADGIAYEMNEVTLPPEIFRGK